MNTSAYKADSEGNVADLSSADNVEVVNAARVLTKADSGKVLSLKNATGVRIDLPTPTKGFKLKVLVGLAFATSNFTVVAQSNIIQGGATVNGAFVPAEDENTISFVATAEKVGDFIELVSDGTNYFVSGNASGAGAITFTAP